MDNITIIGVAGGSGSGKTFFARALHEALGQKKSTLIYQDNYYIDQSARFDTDGGSVNFDHPESLDFKLLAQHLLDLKNGKSIAVPNYDFKTHSRLSISNHTEPTKVIIVDGILILHPPFLREIFDISVFIETDEKTRYERRLKRDIEERGRTPTGVKAQFEKQVKPMHDQFVEPSKAFATYINSGTDMNEFQSLFNYLTIKLY